MTGRTQVINTFKNLRAYELLREKRQFKNRGKFFHVSEEFDADFEKASEIDRTRLKYKVERARKKDIAHSLYIMVVSLLLTMILYFLVGMILE